MPVDDQFRSYQAKLVSDLPPFLRARRSGDHNSIVTPG